MKFNIITKVSVGVALLFMLVFLFSLTGTLCSSLNYSNVSKLRIWNDNFYVIDSNQNVLLFGTKNDLENDNAKIISERLEENVSKPFEALKDVAILQNGEIFLIDGIADGIFEYDKNGEFAFDHNRFENGASITDLVAICGDYNDNVYALQADNGYKILKKAKNDDYFSVFKEITESKMLELGISEEKNAILTCDFENQTLFVASSGKLLKIMENDIVSLCTYSGKATDIAIDYLGYPYLALDSGTILKYQEQQSFLEIATNTFSLNFENGEIYYINNGELKTFTSSFVNNLSNFVHPVDYLEKTNLTASATICNVTANSYVYKYPLKVSILEEIQASTKVIKLAESQTYTDYSYVLLSKNNVLTPCYIKNANLQPVSYHEINQQMRTFTTNTKLFKYPTADSVDGTNSLYLLKIPATTSLIVKNDACNFTDGQYRLFYEVVYQDKIYYVLRSMLTTLGTEEGAISLKPNNAELKSKENVKIYTGLNSDNIIGTMTVGANFYVNIKTFDKKAPRTYVEYLDENNKYICGFIDTKYVKLKEVSPFIIVGVFMILIVMILILILILYFAKEHKKVKYQLNIIKNEN